MNSIACFDYRESDHTIATANHAPEIRTERVLKIRRQLVEGRYCVAEKLNVVVDRILEDLLNHNS